MYNNYFGQYPSYQNYMQPQYQPMQQRPQMQPMVQQQPVEQEMPFSEVRYGTRAEAEARVVYPNRSIMFIDKNLGEIYIKTANQMGEPSFQEFTFKAKESEKQEPIEEVKIDTQNFLTKEDAKDFLKKGDLKTIDEKLDFLEKQVKINKILKGEDVNGEQTNTLS